MAVGFAVVLNLLLFLAMAWANAPTKRRPPAPDLVAREIFTAAPPPQAPPPAEEAPAAVTEVDPLPLETPVAESAPTPERFELRLDLPTLELPAPRIAVPAARVDAPPAVAGPLAAERADRAPRRVSTPLPPYPPWARLRKMEAVVTLNIVVDALGRVTSVEVQGIDGDERFGEIARGAVMDWTYEPALLNGKPVPVTLSQRVRFQLVD
jgi:protein TonB